MINNMLHAHLKILIKENDIYNTDLDTRTSNITTVTFAKRFKRVNVSYFMCIITVYRVSTQSLKNIKVITNSNSNFMAKKP